MRRQQSARPRLTEAEFLRMVLDLARLRGWLTMHQRPAQTRRGWRTAVQGNGAGWPDIFAIRGSRAIVCELKVGRNKPTAPQQEWLAAFRTAGIEAYVWTERSWPEIERVLTGED